MTDILLTHSYFLRLDPKEFKAMMPYPPLGTLYAASSLRAGGFTVALFDSMLANSETEIETVIHRHKPKLVVIYDDDFNYLTKMCLARMRGAAFTMASIAKRNGCTVIVHGSDPVDHLEEYLGGGVDFVIRGEGEKTLLELVNHLVRGLGHLPAIDGLGYSINGDIVRTSERTVSHELDRLPFPAWDLIDIESYRQVWRDRHGYFSVNMVTTRGCPYHCNWCAKPLYGQVYNSRSPRNVVDEMLFLKEKVRPDHLWMCDDIFGLRPGWVDEFATEVRSSGATIPFKCLTRVDLLLRHDTISHLRRAGCQTVWVGAESGSQKILDAMEKGTTVGQIYQAARELKNAKMDVGFFLQFGYPGETMEDILLTLKMVRECLPDHIGISVSYPLPGTKFYDRVRQDLGDKHNWIDSEDLDMMFQGTFHPDFYRVLHQVTHKRFRIWQGLQYLQDALASPFNADRKRLRRIASTAYHAITLPPLERKLTSLSQTKRVLRADEPVGN